MIRRVFPLLKRSIRWQLIAGVALVHAVLMSIFVWDLVQRQERMLHDQVVSSTAAFLDTFSRSVALWMAAGDYQAVQDAVDEARARHDDLKLLMVVDDQGRVLAHTERGRLGQYVVDEAMELLLKEAAYDVIILHDTPRWLDMAAPVMIKGRLLGWVRAQKDLGSIAKARSVVIWEGVLYTLVAILIGSVIAWWLGTRLTHRLYRLQQVTEQVAEGRRDVQVPVDDGYDDELSRLSCHFATMLSMLREQERDNIAERDRLDAILSVLPEAVVEVDEQGHVVYANPMMEQLAGQTLTRMVSKPLLDQLAIVRDNGVSLWREGTQLGRMRQSVKLKVMVRDREGLHEEAMLLRVVPLETVRGEHHVVLLFEYLSESQHLLDELAWQADHDPLTRLHNRRALERHLHQQLDALQQQSGRHGLMLVQFNLDHFKQVNEVAGFSVGDRMLQEVAQLLYARLHEKGFLARLNGDDFVVVLKPALIDSVTGACRLARELIDEVARYPFEWRKQRFMLSMRAGVLVVSGESSVEEALLKLDYAARAAKEKGDGHCVIYADGMLNHKARFAQVRMLNEIKRALREESFELFCQPVVALDGSGKRTGEVLVRLRSEDGELISPFHFLPVAERFGLMAELDLHIVERAIGWLAEDPSRLDQLNINLSGVLLQQQNASARLMAMIERQPDTLRRRLCFEVTETAAIYDISETAAMLGQLRRMGCHIAIDDFGSGYASFSYLKSLPADFVKIDGAFVRGMNEDRINLAMVRAINSVAHEMGMAVVAEFVETEQIARMLRDLGIEFAQGYCFSPPVPIEEISDALWHITLD